MSIFFATHWWLYLFLPIQKYIIMFLLSVDSQSRWLWFIFFVTTLYSWLAGGRWAHFRNGWIDARSEWESFLKIIIVIVGRPLLCPGSVANSRNYLFIQCRLRLASEWLSVRINWQLVPGISASVEWRDRKGERASQLLLLHNHIEGHWDIQSIPFQMLIIICPVVCSWRSAAVGMDSSE